MGVVWLSLAGSLLAVAANTWAVFKGDPRLAPMRASIAALAMFYAAGYIWLLNTGDQATWSQFYRRVAIIVWPIVWAAPPFLGARAHQRRSRRLQTYLEER